MQQILWLLILGFLLALPARAQTTPQVDNLKKEAILEVEDLRGVTQQIVDQVFSYSELGFQEVETAKYLTGVLDKNGFRIERGVAGIPSAWMATYGSGKPVIVLMSDIDCVPSSSQKPGVAYHDPIVAGAPGHGEGHNAGPAVSVTAAVVVKNLMEKYKLAGTLKVLPGVAEELLAAKAYYVRAGLFQGADVVISSHVGSNFGASYGQSNIGLISVQYSFQGRTAHSATSPWLGRSALDAVELMNYAWNMWREHLRVQQRSHYVISNGGDQPNVVPDEAAVWYYFREVDYPHVMELYELANRIAEGAAAMTETRVTRRILGAAWPAHFNKVVAETLQKNIEIVGMPEWDGADQTLARALQKEIGGQVEGLSSKIPPLRPPGREPGSSSNDLGDITWNVPTAVLSYPANIPNLPGHHWASAVAMATPIAHKGSTAGAKALAATVLDFLTSPQLVQEAWAYFRTVQTKEVQYKPMVGPNDQPAIELNKDNMAKVVPELSKFYYDPAKHKTYLEQLGVMYPTIRE